MQELLRTLWLVIFEIGRLATNHPSLMKQHSAKLSSYACEVAEHVVAKTKHKFLGILTSWLAPCTLKSWTSAELGCS